MDAAQIKQQIETEIGNDWSRSNLDGVDLRKCLVEPVKLPYKDASSGERMELWLVLEERPDTRDGYKIIYDETEDQYGLACLAHPDDVFIGYYGSFLETLKGM